MITNDTWIIAMAILVAAKTIGDAIEQVETSTMDLNVDYALDTINSMIAIIRSEP